MQPVFPKPMALAEALRIGRRALRSLVGRDLFYRPEVAVPCLRLGDEGASWTICPEHLGPGSVVYSFGVGTDLSFELALIERFKVRVEAFEPTPRSLQWIRSQRFPPQLIVHEFGLAPWDGTARFTPPRDSGHVSYRMVRSVSDAPAIEAPVCRLETIAGQLNHTRIDVLKMDIEGAEYGVLADCLSSQLVIDQILVEFHHRWSSVGIAETRKAVELLRREGYRIAHVSASGCEYVFLRSREPR
jgi:FkbM family methyltransferase